MLSDIIANRNFGRYCTNMPFILRHPNKISFRTTMMLSTGQLGLTNQILSRSQRFIRIIICRCFYWRLLWWAWWGTFESWGALFYIGLCVNLAGGCIWKIFVSRVILLIRTIMVDWTIFLVLFCSVMAIDTVVILWALSWRFMSRIWRSSYIFFVIFQADDYFWYRHWSINFE